MTIRLHRQMLHSVRNYLYEVKSVAQNEGVLLEYTQDDLSERLIAWHTQQYPWHHRDTRRSYTQMTLRKHGNNGKRTDFAYMQRAAAYFGYNQFDEHRAQPNKLICVWDPSTDGDNFGEHNPCLVLVRFRKEGRWLLLSAVYRKRDLLTRMIGNVVMLTEWLRNEAERRRLKAGVITDYSMEATYNEDALQKHLKMLNGR